MTTDVDSQFQAAPCEPARYCSFPDVLRANAQPKWRLLEGLNHREGRSPSQRRHPRRGSLQPIFSGRRRDLAGLGLAGMRPRV